VRRLDRLCLNRTTEPLHAPRKPGRLPRPSIDEALRAPGNIGISHRAERDGVPIRRRTSRAPGRHSWPAVRNRQQSLEAASFEAPRWRSSLGPRLVLGSARRVEAKKVNTRALTDGGGSGLAFTRKAHCASVAFPCYCPLSGADTHSLPLGLRPPAAVPLMAAGFSFSEHRGSKEERTPGA
jgi:hypothetical protein